MRNWKKQISRILVVVFILGVLAAPASAFETDVAPVNFFDIDNHWATDYMTQLIEMGIVQGYEKEIAEDGETLYEYYAKPDQNITRGEFATMLAKTLAYEPKAAGAKFPDVENHWAKGYVNVLSEKAIINGYPDGTFAPNKTITRGEIATMVANSLSGSASVTEAVYFTDVKSTADHWSYNFLVKAAAAKIITGYKQADGTYKFEPNKSASRAEVMTMLANFLNNDKTVEGTPSDEELVANAVYYVRRIETVLKSQPDLNNKENPLDWTAAYIYATGAEKLELDEMAGIYNGLATIGLPYSFEITELKPGAVLSKSDHTAVLEVYSKITMKVGNEQQVIESTDKFKLMKENGKWLIYATVER